MTQKEKLRERKIYNNYVIAKLGDNYFVDYVINNARSCLGNWWGVYHIGYKFKDTAWYTHGAMEFACYKKSNKEPLMKALEFASKVSNCYEWIKTPFSGYVSRFTADKVGFKYKEINIIKIIL